MKYGIPPAMASLGQWLTNGLNPTPCFRRTRTRCLLMVSTDSPAPSCAKCVSLLICAKNISQSIAILLWERGEGRKCVLSNTWLLPCGFFQWLRLYPLQLIAIKHWYLDYFGYIVGQLSYQPYNDKWYTAYVTTICSQPEKNMEAFYRCHFQRQSQMESAFSALSQVIQTPES